MEKKMFNCEAGKKACMMQLAETLGMLAVFALAIGFPLMGIMS